MISTGEPRPRGNWSPRIHRLPPERRSGEDRRALTARSFLQGGLTPRRHRARRAEETALFVDWHEPHLFLLAVSILALSVLDAFLTLTLLAQGAHEANPLLDWLLDAHPALFASVKMGLTGAGVVVLVAAARARVFKVRVVTLMHACLAAYGALIYYEWMLLSRL